MGIKERKDRERVAWREEIVGAPEKVFFQKGSAASTMDEVAEAAELSKGTLFLYYRSKDDMAMRVVLRGLASSAILTLVVVPVVYTYIDAMRQKVLVLFRRVA